MEELRKRKQVLVEYAAKSEPKLKAWVHPFYIFEVIKAESE